MRDSVFRHYDILNIEYREITLRLRFHSRVYHFYFTCNFRLHQLVSEHRLCIPGDRVLILNQLKISEFTEGNFQTMAPVRGSKNKKVINETEPQTRGN